VLRVSAAAETAGIPSVSIIGSGFMKQSALVSKGIGLPLAIAEYPGAPMVDSDEAVTVKVEKDLMPAIIQGLTLAGRQESVPTPAEPSPGSIVFKGTLDQVQEHFHRQLWSDGLPVIPPTRRRVDTFLKFTNRNPEDVIRVLPQEGRAASILSIAVNGVMAGCRPEYMPVLIAIAEAVSDPYFRIEGAGSTAGWEPLVIVSGPIVKQLGLSFGAGVMKVGPQANTSIGRFARLFFRNICGYRVAPGAGDKSSIGYTFNVALAENEDWVSEIGWPTFAQDLGFNSGENVVTVQSVVCISPNTYSAGDAAISHVQQFVDVIGRAFGPGSQSGLKVGYWHPLIVVGPSIAQVIARSWSKDEVREYFWKNATVPASLLMHQCLQISGMELDFAQLVEQGVLPREYSASDDPDRAVRIVVKPEHIGLVVAGDPGRNQSRGYMGHHKHGARTSRRVELPENWPRLLEEVRT
jgi:hypothetical protein